MTDLETVDYFRDEALALDPYDFYAQLRVDRPVWREPHYGAALVTGYEEALRVLRDPATFSSCNMVAGPAPNLPVALEGDDVTELVMQHRESFPQNDQITTFDPPLHTAHRGLLMGLITPKRLKENEEFMWRLADRQLDQILPAGNSEFIAEFAQPYAMLVIADLLGVPEADHGMLLTLIERKPYGLPGSAEYERNASHNVLAPLYDYFIERIEQRRTAPQGDVLTGIAQATFPDGTLPEPLEVARISANLFAAGRETTVRLIGAALQVIGDRPDLQKRMREDRTLIPRFVEETLRIEGPVKGDFRLALRTTSLGGVDIPAGTTVMVLNAAANRDPRQFENPDEFQVERSNARRHLGFGHGIHTCPGAPLARAEVRVAIERLFDRTADIRVSERAHGPASAREYEYMQTYMFRGLTALNLEFEPLG